MPHFPELHKHIQSGALCAEVTEQFKKANPENEITLFSLYVSRPVFFGPANGVSLKNGATSAIDKGCWTIGLVNSKFKYLSAETFGFRTNSNGKSLKKKQVWVLEPSQDAKSVTLKSHLDKYLSVDQFGNVTCDQVLIHRSDIG